MPSIHGHGYTTFYEGPDQSAAREFTRLTDFASEVEVSMGGMSVAITDRMGPPIVYSVPTLLDFTFPMVSSGDCVPSPATDRINIRYGGMYAVNFFGSTNFVLYDSGLFQVEIRLNGALLLPAIRLTFPLLGAVGGIAYFTGFNLNGHARIPDESYLEVWVVPSITSATEVWWGEGTGLRVQGFRLYAGASF